MENKLISVIIPVCNTEKYVAKCLDSILNQTYKNIEVIAVNDGSTDNSASVLEEYSKKDSRIKIVTHEKNRGLFRARITGMKVAKGDYFGFIDSDDYISPDYYRRLLWVAEKNNCDAVAGKVVHEDSSGYRYVHNSYYTLQDEVFEGDEVLDKFLEQEGLCFVWHTIWNKLYSRKVWDKALLFLDQVEDHIIMCEDVLFSSVAFTFIKKFATTDYAYNFYLQHSSASTAVNNNFAKFKKNITDLTKCFNYVENYYKSINLRPERLSHFQRWKELYSRFWVSNINGASISGQNKKLLFNILKSGLNIQTLEPATSTDNYFYRITTAWDTRYDNIIKKIIDSKHKVISFDIFDTVVTRPFLKPTDLFLLLDNHYDKICSSAVMENFSDLRILAEKELRNNLINAEEVTIDQIYDLLVSKFHISKKNADEMKKIEIETELKFFKSRQSVMNLIDIAKSVGKKVICISDFYIGKNFIERIFENLNISVDEIYVSCEYGLTKETGSLFSKVLSDLKIKGSELLHIGDNWNSDYVVPTNLKIDAQFYSSTKNAFMYEISDIRSTNATDLYKRPSGMWINYEKSLKFLEVRCALALCANKIYDNPFYSFNEWTLFNSDANLMGYFALGMHLWGVAKWLYNENLNKSGTIHFIARDGFLPKLAYDVINRNHEARKSNYVYVSRKALMPLTISNKDSFYYINNFINLQSSSPRKLITLFKPLLDENKIKNFDQNKLDDRFESLENAYDFIDSTLISMYSKTKQENYNINIKNYFANIIKKGDTQFDIGYSGRTQILLSKLLGFNIDAYFIHINDDSNILKQKENKIRIKSFYDYSPSITGSTRETLISELVPSCTGYDFESNKPIFEKIDYNYCWRFAVEQIQKQALQFVKDMTNTFGVIDEFNARNIDLSMPYEYMLHCATYNDTNFFQSVMFEDELYEGKSQINLSDIWQRDIAFHHIMTYKKPIENFGFPAIQIGEQGVYGKLYEKINEWFPVGSKRRKFAKKIGKLFIGKDKGEK